jgi:hypothetical protein
MSRTPLFLLLGMASLAFAQNAFALSPLSPLASAASASTSPVQVVYAVEGTTIVTYDVDPQTLIATQVGTPLTVSQAATLAGLIPVPHGRFLYVVAYDTNFNEHLSVYATDETGAPESPATQQMNATGFYGLVVDPLADFAYTIFESTPAGSYYTTYVIRRYMVDAVTGALSNPEVEAKYVLDDGAEGTTDCYLQLLGFNPTATALYDVVSCIGHDGESGTYNEHSLNPQTGALGPDVEIYSWSNQDGYQNVQFVGNLMFVFASPNDFQQGFNTVDVYPLQPNTSQPLVQCTESMLEACGYTGGVVHPSGKYIFMAITADSTQIDRVELSQQNIVDTGNYIPYPFSQFSPDGTLAYAFSNISGYEQIEIYGFDAVTGSVTPGEGVYVPSNFVGFYVAERD